MDIIFVPLFSLLQSILSLYQWVIILHIIFSWLITFNLINTSNGFIMIVTNFLYNATEPLLQRIRRFMPNLGGLDLSPLVLIFALMFLSNVLARIAQKFL